MSGRACVVVLNWNGRDYIRDCVRSALAQTYPDFRVIVVDNGSPDRSGEIVRDEFPEATYLPLSENLHFARGSNAGIEVALRDSDCSFVVTLNNDTRVDPDWLTELVRPATEPHVGIVASKLVFMDRPNVINSAGICIARDGSGLDRGWNARDGGPFDEPADVFGASAGAALYRREVFEEVGLFDADFVAYYEDLDLAWRARLAGWEARYAPGSVVHHKYSASSAPRSPWKTYQGERNRIWNLAQNYPWRHVATGIPWNAARLGIALARRLGPHPHPIDPSAPDAPPSVAPFLRGRIDGYAGLRRAIAKRRSRDAYRVVDASTVAGWFRTFGVGIAGMPAGGE
ncbi:MAG: glycosyltransferase family 2 protein [Methanobacteriota archaeon]|nr:MAG: glycosyltransferase family 2 protein [Euryarchaeota archaeon]